MSENLNNPAENPEEINQDNANNNAEQGAEQVQTTTQQAADANQDAVAETPENENAVNALLDQVNELKDKYLRLQAEFDNYKKRNAKERMDLMMTANKEVIISMLEVLDDADRAEAQMKDSTDINAIKEGNALVFNKLRKSLEAKGVEAMTAKGAAFNVEMHEAITEIPMPGMEGKVIDEVVKGYYLNDKLIRFAKVVIGK
jgi:molecular chaperone GrpE